MSKKTGTRVGARKAGDESIWDAAEYAMAATASYHLMTSIVLTLAHNEAGPIESSSKNRQKFNTGHWLFQYHVGLTLPLYNTL